MCDTLMIRTQRFGEFGKTKSTQLRTRWRVPSKYLGIMRTALSMLKPGLSIYSQSIRLENFVTVVAQLFKWRLTPSTG